MKGTRNVWLLAALGLIVVAFLGEMGYRRFYEEPLARNEQVKERLGKRLQEANLDLAKAKQVGGQLEQLEQKSLPWDADMARARYQGWLIQLAQDAKLASTSVDPGDPVSVTRPGRGRGSRPVEMFKRFNFSLRGRGDLGQITRFLYDFYRGGHLHKIRTLSLNPIGQGQQVDMSVSIEAIALPNADREAELTTLVSTDLALEHVRDYQLIARRNFFGRDGAESAWRQIELSAITSDVRGTFEAWFRVGTEKQTRILQIGQAIAMPSFDLSVEELEETSAVVRVDGDRFRLAIGQSLAEATRVE
jgi:hypothetical protein